MPGWIDDTDATSKQGSCLEHATLVKTGLLYVILRLQVKLTITTCTRLQYAATSLSKQRLPELQNAFPHRYTGVGTLFVARHALNAKYAANELI